MGERWERFKEYMRGTDDLMVLEQHRSAFQSLGHTVLKAAERSEELSDQAGNRAYTLGQANFQIKQSTRPPAQQLELPVEILDNEVD
jgi:hypothetical protein